MVENGNSGVPGYGPTTGDAFNDAGGGAGLINKANYAQLWQMVTGMSINGQSPELNPTGLNFQIPVGGASYGGPFIVTYDATTDNFTVGSTRDVLTYNTDIVISGLDHLELSLKEIIPRGTNTDGYIYYDMIGQVPAPGFAITLMVSDGGAIPAQTVTTAKVFLARFFYDGTTMTHLRQLQFGNIIYDGRW